MVMKSKAGVLRAVQKWFSTSTRHACSSSAVLGSHGAASRGNADDYVQRSMYPPTLIPTGDLAQYCLERCSQNTGRTAVIDGVTGRSLTYGNLIDGIHRWGAVVQKRSRTRPQSTTVVALFMYNCPDYPILMCGAALVGATLTTLNASYTAEEVAHQLEDSGACLLVVGSDQEGTALKGLRLLRDRGLPVPEIFVVGHSTYGHSDLRSLFADPTASFADPVDVDPGSVAVIPFSSGTTGKPKGVLLTHRAMTVNLEMLASSDFLQVSGPDVADRYLGLLPFFHIYGMFVIMLQALRTSSTVITLPKFEHGSFVQALKEHKFTAMAIVPPLMKFINETEDVKSDYLQSCHSVLCGAAPTSKSSCEQFTAKCGGTVNIREGYGMTEILVTHGTPMVDGKLGFCGRLLPHVEAKVVDITAGSALPPGKRGELLVKTPSMMAGYHNRPEATKETIDEDGWLHTGDIAVYDEDGFFSIVDRMKELIKVKGFQVSPSELEDVLLKHPAIADVGVIGVPHDNHGEVPRAYIVKSKKSSVTEAEVHQYMKEYLAPHKQLLGGVKFVTELPKNATGKLLRKELTKIAVEEV